MVLTQQKRVANDKGKVVGTFPYHYGSYATSPRERNRKAYRWFPYHYGSYATERNVDGRTISSTFPYHYGSYATKTTRGGNKSPRFPYHYGSYATYYTWHDDGLPVEPRFHTTMVLTQLLDKNTKPLMPTTFPYHYGSYATMVETAPVHLKLDRFHTTMVLTQRLDHARPAPA
mgnify:CR=1 FL=1